MGAQVCHGSTTVHRAAVHRAGCAYSSDAPSPRPNVPPAAMQVFYAHPASQVLSLLAWCYVESGEGEQALSCLQVGAAQRGGGRINRSWLGALIIGAAERRQQGVCAYDAH